jgi:integrase
MFTMAEKWGLRPEGSNPCRYVERFPEGKRQRYLSTHELAALGVALAKAERLGRRAKEGGESVYAVAALRLLIFTGCRMSEVLTLRWQDVDLGAATIRLPDSKTGRKEVLLNAPARQLLSHLPRLEGHPYVIAGGRHKDHLKDLERPWRRIRKLAGLHDARVHDLRHSFASVGAGGGQSLPIIGALLGHTQAATTQRYAHLSSDPLRQASEAIGEKIRAAMSGKKADGPPTDISAARLRRRPAK